MSETSPPRYSIDGAHLQLRSSNFLKRLFVLYPLPVPSLPRMNKVALRKRPSEGDFNDCEHAEKKRAVDDQLLDMLRLLRRKKEDRAVKEGRRVFRCPYRCCLCKSDVRDREKCLSCQHSLCEACMPLRGGLPSMDESLAMESNIDKEIPAANLDALWAEVRDSLKQSRGTHNPV
ncbi:hypothetical protein ACJ73_10046 [Blastomyces percursus]|uniref:Uncharacterized protein n=1 Tax=Blastomyces percursus TaxID=1658174 RepID=A0A1J9P205_9EURO|nr:hypothetical protein ACJ73_10046 [Blastomyces percursus]